MSIVKYKYNKYNSWNEIKHYCENYDFSICHFVYDGTNITINKSDDEITLRIDYYTEQSIVSIVNNLPENITILTISISDTTKTKLLEKILTNLPFGLKLVKFDYMENKLFKVKNIESDGKFNVLFGIKIPFNCRVVVNYENTIYDVKYNDFYNGKDNQHELKLELRSKEQTFIIKYVDNSYIPMNFLYNFNPGLALPLIALQYSDVKINIEFNNL